MFRAVKVIDREGRGMDCCFQYTFDRGKVRSLRSFWFTAGPPNYKLTRGPGKLTRRPEKTATIVFGHK